MNSEIEIYLRDSVKLNILNELISGKIRLRVQLNDESSRDYASQIHAEGSRVHVCGKFNLSESPDGSILTIRPIAAGDTLRLYPTFSDESLNQRISLIRSSTKSLEKEFILDSHVSVIDISPNNERRYTLRVITATAEQNNFETINYNTVNETFADTELNTIECSIADVEKKRGDLERLKSSARERLAVIEQEYQKDQSAYELEIKEIRAQMTVDEAVIEYYKDKDITSTEALIADIKTKLAEVEEQIRFFIEAKQNKTMEIENEIKSGNKI